MGTVVVGGVLLAIVALAVRSLVRDHRAGKSVTCDGDCGSCGHLCE